MIADFPVGSRIAFDAMKGRLWIVCRGCERWNLSPLEERWEVVEQAETYYHGTRRRVATEHIGLARLPGGTELVRIGEPLRPEFAAWRYGDQFGRRRFRRVAYSAAGLGVIAAGLAGGAGAGLGLAAFVGIAGRFANNVIHGRDNAVVARLSLDAIGTISVRRRHLAETRIVRGSDAPIALELRYKGGAAQVEGREALRVAGVLMPHLNRFGGKRRLVESAVGVLEQSGGPEGYIDRLARHADSDTYVPSAKGGKLKPTRGSSGAFVSGLFGLKTRDRLALEMALHEGAELRALHGQLTELERAWREAEEIASIADSLLVPGSIREALNRLRNP